MSAFGVAPMSRKGPTQRSVDPGRLSSSGKGDRDKPRSHHARDTLPNAYAPKSEGAAPNRGQNINHVRSMLRPIFLAHTLRFQLLSFTLPPRLPPPSTHSSSRRPRRGGASVPFNKDRYVHAQYRFLVKPTGDYTAYFADADIYLNWHDILTVLIPTTSTLSSVSTVNSVTNQSDSHEGASCPICLSSPTAPRMTKCGHVFCFPCILHYLSVHETPMGSGTSTPTPSHYVPGAHRPAAGHTSSPSPTPSLSAKWKRCPVCWDAVYSKDLKAVQWWDPKARAQEFDDEVHTRQSNGPGEVQSGSTEEEPIRSHPFSTGKENLCMRLIERPHLTTLALPQSSTWPHASTSTSEQPLIAQHSAPWHFQPDVMTFCKFMLATPDGLLTDLNRDLQELGEERVLLESFGTKDEVSLAFVDMAERKVHEQMEKVTNELDTQSVRSRIGYARKELQEHYEMDQGIKARTQEAISRRQRKKLERGKREGQDAIGRDGLDSRVENEQLPSTKSQTHDRTYEYTQAGDEAGQEHRRDPAQDSSDSQHDDSTQLSLEGQHDDPTQEFLAVQAQRQGGAADVWGGISDGQSDMRAPKDNRGPSVKTRRNLNPPAPSTSSYFFYQASSGQNIFLHPLDIKLLHSTYGSYASFPKTLHVTVQGADEGSMNEEMRKRCKYLTHLTKGSDIVFIEVNWEKMAQEAESCGKQAPVSLAVLKSYDHALRQRRNRRRDKHRREDRAKLRSEEMERTSQPSSLTTDLAADMFPSSLGSNSTLSPTLQEALLRSTEDTGPSEESPRSQIDDEHDASSTLGSSPTDHVSKQVPGKWHPPSTTVWGTPAAKNNAFASALHSSSRTGDAQYEDEANWDAWFDLEEDFIVGARNGNSVREGRGLNRQARKGSQSNSEVTTVARTPAEPEPSQESNEIPAQDRSAKRTQGKPQRKKLVLTSGGGGRGTR